MLEAVHLKLTLSQFTTYFTNVTFSSISVPLGYYILYNFSYAFIASLIVSTRTSVSFSLMLFFVISFSPLFRNEPKLFRRDLKPLIRLL